MSGHPSRPGARIGALLLAALLALGAAAPAAAVAPPPYPVLDPTQPPFLVQRFPLPDLPWGALYPHDRPIAPVRGDPPTDADGIPMRSEHGRLVYTPTGIAFQGLRRLDAWVRTGDPAYGAAMVAWAFKLRSLLVRDGATLWAPIPWDSPDQGLTSPWYNALAQGTALAFFVRLARITGDARWMRVADGLFRGFLVLGPGPGPWVGHVPDGRYLWLEHYVRGRRGAVLNAHLYAALGLRDYWQATRSPLARLLTEAAFTTIRAEGERFRRPGTWSWYNLVDQVAHRSYHDFHIRLLRAAAVASGDPWFDGLADRLLEDYVP